LLETAHAFEFFPSTLSMSPRQPFAAIEIHRDPARAAEAWTELERQSPATVYQTARFVTPWYETLGRDLGFAPLVLVARDAEARPAALLALAEKTVGPVRVGFFAGGKDSNANLPLLRPDVTAGADVWSDLLRRAGREAGLDLFALLNQPRHFAGRDNGLTLLPSQDSPGGGHLASLAPDGEAMLAARLSKESRKKYRKKEAKLTGAAPLTVVVSDEAGQTQRILDAFFAQKLARFEEKHIDSTFERPAARAFVEACVASGAVTLYGLDWGGRIVATYGGGGQAQRFSAMFNSFDADEDISKSSPRRPAAVFADETARRRRFRNARSRHRRGALQERGVRCRGAVGRYVPGRQRQRSAGARRFRRRARRQGRDQGQPESHGARRPSARPARLKSPPPSTKRPDGLTAVRASSHRDNLK
jgi:CelD/BcsL family acetyltransferase involved in cellulose biosynthesis